MDFTKILDAFETYKQIEDEIQKAYDKFFEVIASSSFCPVIDRTSSDAYLEGIGMLLPNLKNDILRFYYDISIDKQDTRYIEDNGKRYNINNRDDFIKYLQETYLDY